MNTKFAKTFVLVTVLTACSWLISFGSAVLAGERPFPVATLNRVHQGANQLSPVDQTRRAPVAGLSKLIIEVGSADVDVQAGEGREIVANLKGDAPKDLVFELIKVDSVVTIRAKTENKIFVQVGENRPLKLTVSMPKEFAGHTTIDAGSGDISAQRLSLKEFFVHTRSGDLRMQDLSLGKAELKVGSGDMTLHRLDVSEVNLATGSGDVSVDGLSGQAAEVKTGSGDVRIQFKNSAKWTTLARSGSGDITSDLPGVKVEPGAKQVTLGVGENRLNVNTGSGDIHIAL